MLFIQQRLIQKNLQEIRDIVVNISVLIFYKLAKIAEKNTNSLR
jgi:hypothetical protein